MRAATRADQVVEEQEEEDSDEEDEMQYRMATPRERQFGYGNSSQSSSAGAEPVSLPLSQLHIAAAQRQLPLLLDAQPDVTDTSEVVGAWSELLQACLEQAPQLLQYWHTGVSPLLRLAVAVPRDQWLRSPREPWAAAAGATPGPLVLDGPEGPGEGAEVLPQLRALVSHLLSRYEAHDATASGFTWSDGAGGVLRERPGREVVLCSGIGLQLSLRFVRLHAALGRGEDKPVNLAKDILTPSITKKMMHHFTTSVDSFPPHPPVEIPDSTRHVQPAAVTLASPLSALRAAQVAALGGSPELGRLVGAETRLGKHLGPPEEETFAESVLAWACRFADSPELAEDGATAACVEWLLSQYEADPTFSVVLAGNPRAPKKVLVAARQAAATLELRRLQTTGQRFLPNPAGVRGFVKKGVVTSFGSPFDESEQPQWMRLLGVGGAPMNVGVPNSWHGDEYERSDAESTYLADPSTQRRATVRIDEIMSFEYLQHVGMTMRNCLRMERRGGYSLAKYLSRVKSRESSFWVMTITAEGEEGEGEDGGDGATEMPVQHLLLVEMYNDLRVIHQAEGPHPRRWPRPDAWAWLQEWAAQEGLRPDGPEGVTVGPYAGYDGNLDRWDIRRCFLW